MDSQHRLVLTGDRTPRLEMLRSVADHRHLLGALSSSGFQSQYKQARLGVLWALALPLLQAAVLAVVFSQIVRFETGVSFGAYVLSGIVPWTYFATTVTRATTSIVGGGGIATKVWFPRVLLPLVPAITTFPGFAASLAAVLVLVPILGQPLTWRLALLPVGVVLLVAMSVFAGALLAALDVYFRDVRHMVEAALFLGFYLTPLLYPTDLFGHWAWVFDLNPISGVVSVIRTALLAQPPDAGAIAVSVVVIVVLGIATLEVFCRHDRLFSDRK